MIFGSLLIFVEAAGAKLTEKIDSQFGGGLSFDGSINVSIIFLLLLLYSYTHFLAEWFWQARPQYDLGVNELKALSIRIEREISPLREQISSSSQEFREGIKSLGELSKAQPEESLNPAESRASMILGGLEGELSTLDAIINNIFATSPRAYVTEREGTFLKSSEAVTREDVEVDFQHVLDGVNHVRSEIRRISEDAKRIGTESGAILEMFKNRARHEIEDLDKVYAELSNIADRYDRIAFPKKISSRIFSTRISAGILAWGFGFLAPTTIFLFALTVYFSDCAKGAVRAVIAG